MSKDTEKVYVHLESHRIDSKLRQEGGQNNIKTPIDARKCKICNVFGDEYQFILQCVFYIGIRKAYIKIIMDEAEYA